MHIKWPGRCAGCRAPGNDKAVGFVGQPWRRRTRQRGADQIGQPFDDVDPHRPIAAQAETGDAAEFGRDWRFDGEGRPPRGGEVQQPLGPVLIDAGLGQRPQLRA